MNLILLLTFSKTGRKLLVLVIASMTIAVALPVMALAGVTNLSAVSATSTQGYGETYTGVWVYTDAQAPGDTYDYGNCTYWASLRRMQIGQLIPNTWGNANTWADRATAQDGYIVDHIPAAGAIMQTAAGKFGHVAFVESVDPVTGDWTISEMNVYGYDEVDQVTRHTDITGHYNFIHGKSIL